MTPDEPLLMVITGAHAVVEIPDAVEPPRLRTLPRHRARRPRWKPPLEPGHPQHAYDRDALIR